MIKFFEENGDKYFYLDRYAGYPGKKIFLSEIEIVDFQLNEKGDYNDYYAVCFFERKAGTYDLEPCGYIVCTSADELHLIEKQLQYEMQPAISAFIHTDRALIRFSVFEHMRVYSYKAVRDFETNDPLVLISGQPIPAIETMGGELSRSAIFTRIYIRASDFARVIFATLSNSSAVERNQFDKFMYDVKLYSEIYEIFSKSEEKDCINLFLEMKRGGI